MSTIVGTKDGPRSSCHRAKITVTKEYTDTHVYEVEDFYTDDNEKITHVTYEFVKTYDGIDGENFSATCSECGEGIITDEDTDWEELYV